MAFEATHIRFALDVQDLFEVKDVNKYISGAVYPDSRYPAGIARALTHHDSQMAKKFWENDDFKKGWAAHLLYDKLQFAVHVDWFQDILKGSNPGMTDDEDWVVRTALKILQNFDDLQYFDITTSLGALSYIETPNGEDGDVIREFNQSLIDVYGKAPHLSIEDIGLVLTAWKRPDDMIAITKRKTYELQDDERLMEMISKVYSETIVRTDESFSRYCN